MRNSLDYADKDTFPMPFSLCLRRVVGASTLVIFAVALLGSGTAFAQQTAQSASPAKIASATFPSAAYLRVIKNKDGSAQAAQTAIRRFDPANNKGPIVYLVAAVHIGEADYYKRLQRFLDKQDVVLFEGVWSEKDVPTANPPASSAPRGDEAKANDGLVQLAGVLGLHSQMDIDYHKPNFRHSDLSWEAIKVLAAKSGVDTVNSVSAISNVADGNLASGGAVGKAFTTIIAQAKENPAFAKMLRHEFVELSADPERLAQMQTTEMAKLEPLIVAARNKAVLADLKSLVQTAPEKGQKPPRSVAIFYGGGHMRDMAQHLVADMGYRPGATEWLTAINADSEKPQSK